MQVLLFFPYTCETFFWEMTPLQSSRTAIVHLGWYNLSHLDSFLHLRKQYYDYLQYPWTNANGLRLPFWHSVSSDQTRSSLGTGSYLNCRWCDSKSWKWKGHDSTILTLFEMAKMKNIKLNEDKMQIKLQYSGYCCCYLLPHEVEMDPVMVLTLKEDNTTGSF